MDQTMIGDDDLKHHDEKETDGGEVSSPASQDHRSLQHPFTEGEEVEVEVSEGNSSVRSFASENKSIEGEDFERKNIDIQSPKESRDGSSSKSSSSSSSSSSSDDESHFVKNTVVLETAPPIDFVKPVDSLPEKVTQVNDDLAVEPYPIVDSVKPIDSLSEVVSQENDKTMVEEENNQIVEIPSVTDSDKVSLLEPRVHVNESASFDNHLASGGVELVLKENGEKKLPSLDENTVVSPVLMEVVSQKKEDEVVSTSDVNLAASSELKDYVPTSIYAKDSMSEENEEKLLLSFDAPRADPNNGAEHVNESETPQCCDSQPLVASFPRTAQTTFWKSCCGIFELFTGSSRN